MRRTRWLLYLWPGLPGLWLRGSWPWLAVAVTAGALLNLALLGSFGFTEWIGPVWRGLLWLAVALTWTGAAVASWSTAWRQSPKRPAQEEAETNAFEKALDHYLKGDWFQAERLLVALLQRAKGDVEARLTLATLYRHIGRHAEAETQLDVLLRTDGAAKWHWEIGRERQLLDEAAARDEGQEQPTGDGPDDLNTNAVNAA